MTINRGTGIIKRNHARNYIDDEANKRFEQEVRPYQEQGLNALGVDYFEVLLYSRLMSTQVCTCKQTEVVAQHNTLNLSPNIVNPNSKSDSEITIDYYRPLFGNKTEATNNNDFTSFKELDEDDDLIDESIDDTELASTPSRNLLGANADCAICYKTGFVPGYNLYGWDRKLLCTFDMVQISGYHLNQSTTPHTFQKEDKREGFVEFSFIVPRYFNSVKVSIRNNHASLLDDDIYIKGSSVTPISITYLKEFAGKEVTVRITSELFTHIIFEFDLGCEKVHANLAQQNKNMDWTSFDTLGNINFILPMTVPEVQSSEYVYVPKRAQMFKITDVPYLRVADGRNLDWSVNTRVVQPQEPIRKIIAGRTLY
jgi:hypothetical protein